MRCYSVEKCNQWLNQRNQVWPTLTDGLHSYTVYTKDWHLFALASWIVHYLAHDADAGPALLWITEWGIWPSSENWHLYYQLRRPHDRQLLHEAPGHLFMPFESEEFASVFQVALTNGWGGYLLTPNSEVNLFFSHDEYIDFFAKDPTSLDVVRKRFGTEKDGMPA